MDNLTSARLSDAAAGVTRICAAVKMEKLSTSQPVSERNQNGQHRITLDIQRTNCGQLSSLIKSRGKVAEKDETHQRQSSLLGGIFNITA